MTKKPAGNRRHRSPPPGHKLTTTAATMAPRGRTAARGAGRRGGWPRSVAPGYNPFPERPNVGRRTRSVVTRGRRSLLLRKRASEDCCGDTWSHRGNVRERVRPAIESGRWHFPNLGRMQYQPVSDHRVQGQHVVTPRTLGVLVHAYRSANVKRSHKPGCVCVRVSKCGFCVILS